MATEDEDHALALLDLSIALVEAALDVLNQHIQTDQQLTKTSVLMPGGTVGKHFRHVSALAVVVVRCVFRPADCSR
jgi:hypothetical protein